MKKLIVCSVALLLAGAVTVRAADAKENWEKNCTKSHGPDGKGKTKMGAKLEIKDYSDAKVQDAIKDGDMAKAIKEELGLPFLARRTCSDGDRPNSTCAHSKSHISIARKPCRKAIRIRVASRSP